MNKGTLRTHLIALLNRSDCTTALADTFIDQAMARITRTIRIPSMEKQQTYTISSATGTGAIQIPVDFLESIDLYSNGVPLVRIPVQEMVEYQKSGELGQPTFFCRVQASYLLHPQPTGGTVTLDYYGEFTALANDAATNQLTTVGSDALIYTALGYAADYFLDERGANFDAKAGQLLSEIQNQADASELSGGTQAMRPTGHFQD